MNLKKLLLLIFLIFPLCASAQSMVKYGYISYDSLFHSLPEYAQVQENMSHLRQKYEEEAIYNEKNFKRQFTEFLQGQKEFPQNILLKRQRDLQISMERGIAFRQEADSLLQQAERDMLTPLYQRLDKAIREVGVERGYEYILNLDGHAYPYIHPALSENAAPYVLMKLGL